MPLLGLQIGFLEVHWIDIIDVLLVTILLFQLYKLIRKSVAYRVIIGFLFIYLTYLIVQATKMSLLSEILGQFINVGVIAAVILFQHEIKKFLLLIGKSAALDEMKIFKIFRKNRQQVDQYNINPIVEALKSLGGTNTGALIVITKREELKAYVETGDYLDAKVSKRLLISVFFKNSPLHDGAAIIQDGRVVAARCILPVSDNQEIPANFGLRHRAAIGITEETNAAVLVVSEETGEISFVQNGIIDHNLSLLEVRKKLNEYYTGSLTQKLKAEVENENKIKPQEKNVA